MKNSVSVVAVSEGIHGPGGTPIIDLGEFDSQAPVSCQVLAPWATSSPDKLKEHPAAAQPGVEVDRVRADTFDDDSVALGVVSGCRRRRSP